MQFVAAAAACGGDSHQRVVRHVSQGVRGEPVHLLPFLHVRFDRSSVRQPGVSVGLRRSSCTTSDAATRLALRSSRKPCLLPCLPVPISPGFDPLSPLHGHVHHVSAKWHVNAVSHSPSSFRYCCVFGLESGSRHCDVPPHFHRYPPRVVVRQPCLYLTYKCCGQGR